MGNNSQRRKERHAKKRKEKQKKQAQQQGAQRRNEVVLGSNARHRQRLLQQIPSAWPGEIASDVAVFDDAVLAKLTPELADQVVAVRDALQDALDSRSDDALKRVSSIARASALSEWRLFVRGLIDWLAGDMEVATETWGRLDADRRPGRIAVVMLMALRSDLEQLSPLPTQSELGEPADESKNLASNCFDDQQLFHAKLLRRVRFDRSALRVAEAGLNIPEESEELHLGPRKIRWLASFIAEYRDTEPGLSEALAQAALRRAFEQNFSDLFEEAVRIFPGPRHDRRNRLLKFFYYNHFENDRTSERRSELALNEYLNSDLPKNESLSEPLRAAITSEIHLNEAIALMESNNDQDMFGGGMFNRMFGMDFEPGEDVKGIRKHLRAAIKANPANPQVYKRYVEWIESHLDRDQVSNIESERLEGERADVMNSWSQGIPEAVEPRLWLVDYFLENEQLDEARPHVEFLSASRQDDPRVRATPWKWQLLEAMRLCRRKAWLAQVPGRLDEAEALWPAWLSKEWLPYLRAAWTLRNGHVEAFDEQRREICQESGRPRDSLADACMMLGAAQQMRVGAADLKPFREAIDRALKAVDKLPIEDLFDTGSFFWDLHRVRLVYPGYRKHGSAIGKTLVAALKTRKLGDLNEERIQKAVLWGSEHRFWPTNYETKLPPCLLSPGIERYPLLIAARVNAFLNQRKHWGAEKYRNLGPILREAALQQRDAYYRHWFTELANDLDDVVTTKTARFGGFPFMDPFGAKEDDTQDDDLSFDPNCNCPKCTAARKASQQAG